MEADGKHDGMATTAHRGRGKHSALILFVALLLAVGGAWWWHRAARPTAQETAAVDSLNTVAHALRYVAPDSSIQVARQAARQARRYESGRAEALNHQMFVSFLRMDFGGCNRLYHEIQRTTDNQIELLVGEVNMMMVCQRAAQNRLFADHHNIAVERIGRIMEEYDGLTGRDKRRLDYALTEFSLTLASNYTGLMLEGEAASVLAAMDTEGYLRDDEQLLMYFYYLSGTVALALDMKGEEYVAQAFDYYQLAYALASSSDNAYFRSMAGGALACLFTRPGVYDMLMEKRRREMETLCAVAQLGYGALTDSALPASHSLATRLAEASLADAGRSGNLMMKVSAFRVLGSVMFARGEYYRALSLFENSLSYLNLHHRMYYPGDSLLLRSYGEEGDSAVDMRWARDTVVQTVPSYLMLVRERLSATYSALDDKQKSDYNRNLYLDLMDYTRQDKSLESRVVRIRKDNQILNSLLVVLACSAVLLSVLLFLYGRKWRSRGAKQYSFLKDMSDWFMRVAFAPPESSLEKALDTYPWMWKEKRILAEILRPYMEWMEKNRTLAGQIGEEREQLLEDYRRSERQIEEDKRKNISRRAKVSLVHSIMPLVDRMLYAVRRVQKQGADKETLTYVGELADEINRQQEVLAEWIQLTRGEVELMVGSFPLEELFSLLEKGGDGFRRKGVTLCVASTDAQVKADKALTFFMLNTLVDNARKFTPAGGKVEVYATESEEAVDITVADTGCGLSEEDVRLILSSKIYDSGKIGKNTPGGGEGKGYGFGLLNCKGIIEKYKKTGDLFKVCRFHVESEVGKGSRFSFRLPKGQARAARFGLSAWTLALCLSAASAWVQAAAPAVEGLEAAVAYADSVYFSNVQGDYEASLQYADSAFASLTGYYADSLPASCAGERLTVRGSGQEEISWLASGIDADYFLVMGLRNEIAVAALALHEWETYESNNRKFSHLYRSLTTDESMERFYARQRSVQEGLSVSLVLLVVMCIVFVGLAYVVYFRRRLLFREGVMQVLEANHAMLGVAERYGHPGDEDELVPRLLPVVLSHLKELHETEGICLWLAGNGRGGKVYRLPEEENVHGMLADSLLRRAYETRESVFDTSVGIGAYPLLLQTGGGEQVCAGALAVAYGGYRMQSEDFVFEHYIVNYLAILLYEAVVWRGQELDDVERAEHESRRALFEETRLRVQNQILDNCLSAIKHESMYYPSRIKQVVGGLLRSGGGDAAREVETLKELAEYYKEIYVLLCAQADRQVDTGYFKCDRLPVDGVVARWGQYASRQAEKVGLAGVDCENEAGGAACVHADPVLLHYMLQLLTKEWAAAMARQSSCGRLSLRVESREGFVRFALCADAALYSREEAAALFRPDVAHYAFLLCKEIVREHDKLNNFCGCRINADTDCESGSRIWFTVPKCE